MIYSRVDKSYDGRNRSSFYLTLGIILFENESFSYGEKGFFGGVHFRQFNSLSFS